MVSHHKFLSIFSRLLELKSHYRSTIWHRKIKKPEAWLQIFLYFLKILGVNYSLLVIFMRMSVGLPECDLLGLNYKKSSYILWWLFLFQWLSSTESIHSLWNKKTCKKYQLATNKRKELVNVNSKRLGGGEPFLPSCLKIAFATWGRQDIALW